MVKEASQVKIRLEELHYIFSNQLNGEDKTLRFNDIDIYSRNGIVARNAFALNILPTDFYLVLEGSRTSEKVLDYTDEERQKEIGVSQGRTRRATLNRVFKNEGANGAKERFQEIVSLLTHKTHHSYDKYENCKYRIDISKKWEKILNGISETENEHLTKRIRTLISSIPDSNPNSTELKSRLAIAQNKSNIEVLSCLTLIACTLHIWNEPQISEFDLLAQDMILPPSNEKSILLLPSQKMLTEHASMALKKLESIRQEAEFVEIALESAKHCYHVGLDILDIKRMDDAAILGETYFILYKCCKNTRFSIPDGMNADFYLAQSQKYKYPDAMEITLADRDLSLYELPLCGISNVPGICIVNEENDISNVLINTLPDKWTAKKFDGTFSLDSSVPHRYFLCQKNTSSNYQDLLKILDHYKRTWDIEDPYDIEVFILGNENNLASLIDTAQTYMENRIIPIHIINQPKLAAEYLLAKHPLFYPVLDYPIEKEKMVPQTLNFVILGTTKCSEYLLRTAFWMMNFPKTMILPKISLVGRNTGKFLDSVISKCPGMAEEISEEYPSLETYKCEFFSKDLDDYYSSEFDEYFEKLLISGERLYFAIATEDDLTNFEIATALRERMIQFYVTNGQSIMLKNLPPIAFQCKDFHIANMSQKLVVNVLNHGDSWYNNHAIIPFGLDTDIYGYNGLMENPIEHLAKCISLEYNNHSIPVDSTKITQSKKQELKSNLYDYYGKQYNKASSYAVALSLPYKLFNCINNAHRVLPAAWNITNGETYYNYDILSFMADKLRYLSEKTVLDIAKTEHDRWVRWMLSEGWLPASVDDILLYNKEGSEKHQLYIAKMHPCICDWDELENMENDLSVEKKEPVDFRSFDIKSAQKTEQILRGAIALHIAEIQELELELEHSH